MKQTKHKYLVGDFETTIYDEQEYTEVWASAVVEMYTDEVKIFHSIGETFDYFVSLNSNLCVYYHNLKFDGSFWLSYLMCDLHFQPAIKKTGDGEFDVEFSREKMKNNTYKYTISDMGQWYTITIKVKDHTIELRDSLKLLPFSVKKIGDSFGTKHKKLDMEYKGFRYAGCEITDKEKEYIANDVLVVKEALEIMFNQGHKKLTIGTCCLDEYKTITGWNNYKELFPDVYEIPLDEKTFGSPTAGDYIHKSYKGGWCYLVKGKEDKLFHNGITGDVNSLYPSMMSSESNNKYPVGEPTFWQGDFIPDEALRNDRYFFIRIKTRFYLKPNMLPTIQIKGTFLYPATEWLESSDIVNPKTGKKYREYINLNGEKEKASVILTLTMTDYKLICEHYYLVDCTILDGCFFHARVGIFDDYIDKYKMMKLKSTGALRELAKLFLNNLYGKMASSKNSSFKYAYIREDNSIGFVEVEEYNKKPGYIPVGSAITSYARNFTIRAAQKNYYGVDKAGFIYADTDSIHCDLPPEKLKGIKVDSKNFCCWKLEASWDVAKFVRQKTYIEHVVAENLEALPEDKQYYNIRCAGMPERCKQYFRWSMEGLTQQQWETERKEIWDEMDEETRNFVLKKRTIDDFRIGLSVNGKLLPKRIRGGVVLVDTTYEMR